MAGLANFTLSPTDAQSVNAGPPASSARNNAPKNRLGTPDSAVFDAVLNNRQPPAENRKAPDPIDRSSPPSSRRTANFRSSNEIPDRIQRQGPSSPIDRSRPERPVGTDNDARRVSKADQTADTKAAASPGKAEAGKDVRQTGASDDIGATEQDAKTGDVQDAEIQIGPALTQGEPLPQDLPEDAEDADPGQKIADTDLDPELAEKTQGDVQTNTGTDPETSSQTEELLAQFSAEDALAVEKQVSGQAETAKIANPGLATNDTATTPPTAKIAAGGEAVASAAKKGGGGAPAPDADGAAANMDAQTGEDDAPAQKPRNAETGGADKTAKTDTLAPRASAANFAAGFAPALRPAATSPGQPVQGNAAPVQIEAGAAIFRASTPTAQGTAPALPVRAIALHIANKAATGATKFQIRLDPPELGRIDVKLEIARDGRTNVQLTVDRPETLEALIRDQRGLERTLQNAGLDTTKDGLSFNLRQDTEAGAGGNDGDANGSNRQSGEATETSDMSQTEGPTHFIGLSAIDIRV